MNYVTLKIILNQLKVSWSCPVKDCQMAAEICKHILKGRERIPLCNYVTVPVHSKRSHIHQGKTVKLPSSYTIQASALIHHLDTVTSYITPHWMHSAAPLPTLGLLYNRTPALSSWLYEGISARRLIYNLAALYLVSFDSSAWLSSGPPRPLQASLTLWRQTEKLLHFASWNSSQYVWKTITA